MRDVAVVIPTLRRPAMLERALRSVFAQVGSLDRIAAVVVADNDPDGSAAALIDRLRVEAPVPLTYAHAPVPGVATARNVGLAATDARLIAFLDDDEAASPGWLSALLQAQSQTGADVLFGPIRGRVPEGTGWTTAYLERFFGRDGPAQTGLTDQIHGCGNSLMVRATALPGPAPSTPPWTRPAAKTTACSPPCKRAAAGSAGPPTPGWTSSRPPTAPP